MPELSGIALRKEKSDIVVHVNVTCEILGMNEVDQMFTATGYVKMRWTSSGPDGSVKPDNSLNLFDAGPCLFENAISTEVKPEDVQFERKDGVVNGSIGYTSKVTAALNLRRFPYDRHYLLLKIPVNDVGASVTFKSFEADGYSSYAGILGALIEKWEIFEPSLVVDSNAESDDAHYLEFVVPIQRIPVYFIWQVVLPMLLIGCLACTAFAFPVEDLGSRQGLVVTLLLTTMVFKSALSRHLPQVTYQTLLYSYLNVALVVLCALSFEMTWANIHNGSELARSIDNLASWLVVALWAGGHAIFFGAHSLGILFESWDRVRSNLIKNKNAASAAYKYGSLGEADLKHTHML